MHQPFPRLRLLTSVFLITLSTLGFSSPERFQTVHISKDLSQSTVMAVLQDQQGFVWIGTQDGLNRFDGYEFKIFTHERDNPYSIPDNYISALHLGHDGRIWVGTFDHGLAHYDPKTGRFHRYNLKTKGNQELRILTIRENSKNPNELWLGTQGMLFNFSIKDGSAQAFSFPNDANPNVQSIWQTSDLLWIGTDAGLFFMDLKSQHITEFASENTKQYLSITGHPNQPNTLFIGTYSGLFRLEDNQLKALPHLSEFHDQAINCFLWDKRKPNLLWIGTDDGLYGLQVSTGELTSVLYRKGHLSGLTHGIVLSLAQLEDGSIFVGTYQGVTYFNDTLKNFGTRHYEIGVEDSISHNNVWSILEDTSDPNALWIGTDNGLDLINRKTGTVERFKRDRKDKNTLSSNTIMTLQQTSPKDLWVGTSFSLNHLDTQTKKVKRYLEAFPKRPYHPSVYTMIKDHTNPNILWLCTRRGVNKFNIETELFERVSLGPHEPTETSWIATSIKQESQKGENIWVGTTNGLIYLNDKTQETRYYHADLEEGYKLSHRSVLCIEEDLWPTLWVATSGGLNKLNRENNTITTFRTEEGLPSDQIYTLLMDHQNNLWLSTGKGLSMFNPRTEKFTNYDIYDGLQANEFNQNAYHKSKSGELFFGGINGYNSFYPEKITRNTFPPKVALTNVLLANEEVTPQPDNPNAILKENIAFAKKITLNHDQKMISFEFSALHFTSPQKNTYAYKLAGFDKEWNYTDANRRFATYTNLNSGNYTFKVKAANQANIWSNEETSIKLSINPPPWLSIWAQSLYAIIFAALVALYLKIQQDAQTRRRLIAEKDHALVMQTRRTNERLLQIDKLKDEFLANTSHELRTPLNGIIGLAESLADGVHGTLPSETRTHLAMIIASGRRLSTLVDDLLDFSKLKENKLELELKPIDFRTMVEMVIALSKPLIASEKLQLYNKIPEDCAPVLGDENRILQVLHNLIGNAIKFTDEGSIIVSATQVDQHLEVEIRDTGIGIATENLNSIFESFEQVDGTAMRHFSGTGLGLTITKRLIELMSGKIWVQSQLGAGSAFYFTLPLSSEKVFPKAKKVPLQLSEDTEPTPLKPIHTQKGRFHILIADDEPVNRQVLLNHLTLHDYRVTEAASGKEILDLLETNHDFDLLLLDVMMPGMSGYEACEFIRNEYSLYDLPILFLTARNQSEDQALAFAKGGNDFLTKPISKVELLSRVGTHLQLRDIHQNLEEKVYERTRELSQKNEQLQKTQRQLVIQEKMASMGAITAGVAHEIRNPLNFITNFAETAVRLAEDLNDLLKPFKDELQQEVTNEVTELLSELTVNANHITGHGQRANRIVQSMIELANGEAGIHEDSKVNELVEKVAAIAFNATRSRTPHLNDVQMNLSLGENIDIWSLCPKNISRALINMINNAYEAIAEKRITNRNYVGKVTIGTRIIDEHLEIFVEDDGNGISDDSKERIFNPFFTTKADHIGLGLAICFDIVQEHDGIMTAKSNQEKTEIKITLPKNKNKNIP